MQIEAIRSSCAHRDQKAAKAAPDSAWQASNPTPVARCSLLRPLTSLAAVLGHAQGSQPSLEGSRRMEAADVRTNNVLLSTPADPLATSGLDDVRDTHARSGCCFDPISNASRSQGSRSIIQLTHPPLPALLNRAGPPYLSG